MGAFEFNRREYAGPRIIEPRPSPPNGSPVFLIIVVAVGGFIVYKLLGTGRDADSGSNRADFAQIEQRLEGIEHRLDQLERRRRLSAPEPVTTAPKQDPPAPHPSPPPVQTIYRFSPPLEPPKVAAPAPSAAPPGSQVSQQQQKELDSLRGDVTSTREEWEAATNRLGNVLGELASQRDQIARHGETLEQLASRSQHNSVPFTLQRGGNPQRVGPVSMRLQSTDIKNQRYTIRVLTNDKVIELKDRALDEAVQFYGSSANVLLELVVSEVHKDAVTGRLGLPQAAPSR